MRILYSQPKSRSRENWLVLEGKSMTKAKVLAEFEATKILDHLAPDWPLLLYDGAMKARDATVTGTVASAHLFCCQLPPDLFLVANEFGLHLFVKYAAHCPAPATKI